MTLVCLIRAVLLRHLTFPKLPWHSQASLSDCCRMAGAFFSLVAWRLSGNAVNSGKEMTVNSGLGCQHILIPIMHIMLQLHKDPAVTCAPRLCCPIQRWHLQGLSSIAWSSLSLKGLSFYEAGLTSTPKRSICQTSLYLSLHGTFGPCNTGLSTLAGRGASRGRPPAPS